MYGIAKSIAKGKPFERPAFPKLKGLAIDEVATNFILYPELSGLSEEIKEKVKKINYYIFIKRLSIKRVSIMNKYQYKFQHQILMKKVIGKKPINFVIRILTKRIILNYMADHGK